MSLELLRVEFVVVGLERDDETGEIRGERPLAQGTAYPSGLTEFPAKVQEIVEAGVQQ